MNATIIQTPRVLPWLRERRSRVELGRPEAPGDARPVAPGPAADLRLRIVRSGQELLAFAEAWDELWQRSAVCSPRARAALVALWLEHFAPNARFRAVMVERNGRLLAALPLVTAPALDGWLPRGLAARLQRWLPAAWCAHIPVGIRPCPPSCGDLLLDEGCEDLPAVLHALLQGLKRLRWPLLVLKNVEMATRRWQALLAAADQAGMLVARQVRCAGGRVRVAAGQWERYFASRSANLRGDRRKEANRLARAGGAELHVSQRFSDAALLQMLQRGLDLEDSGWKGSAGISVLKAPLLHAYLVREAQLLAECGMLQLVFLESGGRPIAFSYNHFAKGACHGLKMGYDQAQSRLGPGQQMLMRLLEHLHGRADCRFLDFGPLAPWTERWVTETYPIGSLILNPWRLPGRGLIRWLSRRISRSGAGSAPDPDGQPAISMPRLADHGGDHP